MSKNKVEIFDNSMQEVIRKFNTWLGSAKISKRYNDNLNGAFNIFWGDRVDLAPIKMNEKTQSTFNEWLMMDFSVNGYEGIPYSERINFLDLFLKEKKKDLSEAGEIFAMNASKSITTFYRVLATKPGESEDLEDLLFGGKIRGFDVNLSLFSRPGQIFWARFSKNEHGKYIGSGSNIFLVEEDIFDCMKQLMSMTYEGTSDPGETFEEFVKWNSYMYFREVINPFGMSKLIKKRRGK